MKEELVGLDVLEKVVVSVIAGIIYVFMIEVISIVSGNVFMIEVISIVSSIRIGVLGVFAVFIVSILVCFFSIKIMERIDE